MPRHIKGLFGLFIICVVVFLFSEKVALGQTGTTSLRGTVLDKSGAAVSGANVVLNNPDKALHRETKSSASGEYEFLSLPPGTYVLSVEANGFRKWEQKNLQLLVNSPATMSVTLEIGTGKEIIE